MYLKNPKGFIKPPKKDLTCITYSYKTDLSQWNLLLCKRQAERILNLVSTALGASRKPYLFWCANEHVPFRLPEIQSILNIFNISHEWVQEPTERPWFILRLSSEADARKIMSRTLLVRTCVELWAEGVSLNNLHEQLKNLPQEYADLYFDEQQSFRIQVETFNYKISPSQKTERVEFFSYLPLKGPVKLKDPDVTFCYFEYYGLDPNRVPETPYNYFFGRRIADGQRHLISELSLKKRHFIGNTSMDAQLSLIMANNGCVKPCDIVLDPFVGTGSILVAAAQFGAYVCGTDIDYLTIHGRSKPTRAYQKQRSTNEKIIKNMCQYNKQSQYLDVCVADASRPLWRAGFEFDAIITDPPYGIRESTERVGAKRPGNKIPEELVSVHYPSRIGYDMGEIYRDLLNFSARSLRIGGRLVFWIPVCNDDYSEDRLPSHPCLRLVGNSEQILNAHTSRRLVTMEKIKEFKPDEFGDQGAFVCDSQSAFREKYFQSSADVPKSKKDKLPADHKKRCRRGQGVELSLNVEALKINDNA